LPQHDDTFKAGVEQSGGPLKEAVGNDAIGGMRQTQYRPTEAEFGHRFLGLLAERDDTVWADVLDDVNHVVLVWRDH
jgi:hypothetical protein